MQNKPPRSEPIDRRGALKLSAGGVMLAAGASPLSAFAQEAQRASSLGVYTGYSTEAYDGWVRTSQYVQVRDGTRLAVDIYRPTLAKALHKGRLPVVWQAKRYQRAIVQPDGSLVTVMGSSSSEAASYAFRTAQRLVRHGYIIASVDRRGTGASFGSQTDLSNPQDALDGYDITEWLAAQPWSDGKVGMFGASYEGEIQLRVASTKPPHLKAIMPEVSPFDWYWTVHPGGVHRTSQEQFAKSTAAQDVNTNNGPVDSDKDRTLLTAALAEHKAKNDYSAPAGKMPFRDSKNPVTGEQSWLKRHGGVYALGLAASGIAVYHRVGWFTRVLVDQLSWFVSQKGGPRKMLIGPWGVGGAVTEDERAMWSAEAHRFFDYWLKGVQNGIMDEPSIHSSIPSSHTRNGGPWRGLPAAWPLANERRTEFFFEAGKTGTSKSVNDGKLTRAKPNAAMARDDYTVTYECLYEGSNDPAAPGKPAVDHAGFDALGLTYTTEPLEADMEVTGHPIARLWVNSTADDGDFFIKLQDVSPSGASTYVAQGILRASHRALGTPPYEFFGLPWNTSQQTDAKPLAKDGPTQLVFPLFPTSYLFRRGHRVRVTITGSDLNIGPSPRIIPAPLVTVHRSTRYPSSITLPIIPAG